VSRLRQLGTALLDAVFPRRCGLCGLLGPDALCDVCGADFVPLDTTPVRLSGGPLDARLCAYRYRGRAAQAVRRLKYQRVTSLADPMARRLAEHARNFEADLLVPVPIHWSRLHYRGFNQSERLAEAVETVPLAPGALRRIRATRPQVGLDRAQRLGNLRGAFRASPEVEGTRVLLLDDVMTSGGTALECARALKEGGARSVMLLAFASWGPDEPDWAAP